MWRIEHIPSESESRVQANPLAALGALVFVGCIIMALVIKAADAVRLVWLLSGMAGFGLSLLAGWYKARQERRSWIRLKARCIDREWHSVRVPKGTTWTFRILCEFTLEGRHYKATPVYWTTFISEKALTDFLEKVIAPDGTCELYVNPKDPLQVELVGKDIKDLLLN
ncbi:MAG: hypothetical protein RDV48_19905 [Candidatus Eremiobacteraeota bacterium]|nr:hypothetical protein [Candidatus Eremiobacteraeota bacterium]